MHAAFLPGRLAPSSLWWPRLLAAVAAAALLWWSIRCFWLLLAGPELPPPRPPSDSELPTLAAPAASESLSRWHLFGQGATPLNLAQLAREAPETALQLVLKGTLNLQAADGGIAIIADPSGRDEAYRVGDRLPGDAELIGIYAGRVLLRRAGVEEGLSLLPATVGRAAAAPGARLPAADGQASQAGAARAAMRQMTPVAPLATPSGPAFIAPQINVGTPVMATLQNLAGTTDLNELARQVNVIPVLENGRFAGVRLQVGRDSDLLQRSGLRSSDLVTAVNGIPLDGPARQEELLTSLRSARQITLTVNRDGQSLEIPIGL